MDYASKVAETAVHMRDPQPGDRFHEQYSFWIYVVKREGGSVTTAEASAPCSFPDDATFRTYTVDEFIKRFRAGGTYWILYEDSRPEVVKEWTSLLINDKRSVIENPAAQREADVRREADSIPTLLGSLPPAPDKPGAWVEKYRSMFTYLHAFKARHFSAEKLAWVTEGFEFVRSLRRPYRR